MKPERRPGQVPNGVTLDVALRYHACRGALAEGAIERRIAYLRRFELACRPRLKLIGNMHDLVAGGMCGGGE